MAVNTDELKVIFEHSSELLKLNLLTDSEEMKLFLVIQRLGDQFLTEEHVWGLLKSKTSSDMIDPDIVRECIKTANEKTENPVPRRIAKGKPAEPGIDGKLLLLAKALAEKQEKGNQDVQGMYDLHLFDNIEPDRIVARIYPPKSGADGFNALGKKIPATQGKPVQVTIDDTIKKEQGESYEILKAKISGYLERKGNSLSIKEEFVVRGGINLHTGNIDFINKVRVNGDVGSGFRVRGRQGVRIDGAVQSGSVIQGGEGTAFIGGYLVGSRVEAKGDIFLKNIQQGDIETEGWVTIEKQSIESSIRSGCGVVADRAHIFGGSILCVQGVNVGTLGNHAGLRTSITLATKSSVTSAYTSLQNQINSHEEAVTILKAHLGPYAIYPQRVNRLIEPHLSKMKGLLQKLENVEKSKHELMGELKKLQEETIPDDSRVTFKVKAHQGVVITAGEENFTIYEDLDGPKTIVRVEGKFALVDPNPLQKPEEDKSKDKKSGKR